MDEKQPLLRGLIQRYAAGRLVDEPYVYSLIAQFVDAPTFFTDEDESPGCTVRRHYVQYGAEEPLLHSVEFPAVYRMNRYTGAIDPRSSSWYLWGHEVDEETVLGFENVEDVTWWAVENGYADVLNYISGGARRCVAPPGSLEVAVDNGHLEVVKYLVERCGARVNDALMYAAESADLEIVKYLVLERGANVDVERGMPLELAVLSESLEVVQFLVEHDAFVTPRIVRISRSAEVTKYLQSCARF